MNVEAEPGIWQEAWRIQVDIDLEIVTVTDERGRPRELPRFRYRVTTTVEGREEPVPEDVAGGCVPRARRGDTLVWRFDEGPFAVHFAPLSPVDRISLHARKGKATPPARVTDLAPYGRYEAFVAVYSDGRVWTDDPPFEIGPK